MAVADASDAKNAAPLATQSASDQISGAVAKRMPRRLDRSATGACTSAAPKHQLMPCSSAASASVAAPSRGAPKRKITKNSARTDGAAECPQADRAGQQPVSESSKLSNPQMTVSRRAELLQAKGVLKLAKPIHYNLASYWASCIVPLCALLKVHPLLALRRSGDEGVRVPYVPIQGKITPVFLTLMVETCRDLRSAIAQIGGQLVALWYLSFHIQDLTTADTDPDTDHGAGVRVLLQDAVNFVNDKWELACSPVGIFLPDVGQLIIIARPLYFLEP
eukprot:3825519-Amphidinium_carterae.1